jgi:hypothetical protein
VDEDRRVLYYLKSESLTTGLLQDLLNRFKVVFVEKQFTVPVHTKFGVTGITLHRFYRVGQLEMRIAREFQTFLKLSYRKEVVEIEKEKFLEERKGIVSHVFCMV